MNNNVPKKFKINEAAMTNWVETISWHKNAVTPQDNLKTSFIMLLILIIAQIYEYFM